MSNKRGLELVFLLHKFFAPCQIALAEGEDGPRIGPTPTFDPTVLLSQRLQFRLGKVIFGDTLLFRRQTFFEKLGSGKLIADKEVLHPRVKPGFTVLAAISVSDPRCGGSKKFGLGQIAKKVCPRLWIPKFPALR